MLADHYLQAILVREAVDTGPNSPVRGAQITLVPILRAWARDRLISVTPSGSFAKGTANRSGTDIDLFVSLSEDTTETLKQVSEKLFNWMQARGYSPSRQNVSIKVKVGAYDVDIVPAKRQAGSGGDHSLYRRKADTWTKTNVTTHIRYVVGGGRLQETRIVKLWRDQKTLDFPSFYLELTVINALRGDYSVTLGGRVSKVFQYLSDSFSTARVVDPANTNNVVSEDLTATERAKVKAAAERALSATDWSEIVR